MCILCGSTQKSILALLDQATIEDLPDKICTCCEEKIDSRSLDEAGHRSLKFKTVISFNHALRYNPCKTCQKKESSPISLEDEKETTNLLEGSRLFRVDTKFVYFYSPEKKLLVKYDPSQKNLNLIPVKEEKSYRST